MKLFKTFLLATVTFFVPFLLFSQQLNQGGKIFLVQKSDGTEFLGEIISDDGREVLMITESIGKVYIRKENISLITETNEIVKKSNKQDIGCL